MNYEYKPEYASDLMKHLDYGHTFASFGAKVRVPYDTLLKWCIDYPEFCDAREIGNLLSLYNWETEMLEYRKDPKANSDFNPALWKFNIQSRFPHLYGTKTAIFLQQEQETIQTCVAARKSNIDGAGSDIPIKSPLTATLSTSKPTPPHVDWAPGEKEAFIKMMNENAEKVLQGDSDDLNSKPIEPEKTKVDHIASQEVEKSIAAPLVERPIMQPTTILPEVKKGTLIPINPHTGRPYPIKQW